MTDFGDIFALILDIFIVVLPKKTLQKASVRHANKKTRFFYWLSKKMFEFLRICACPSVMPCFVVDVGSANAGSIVGNPVLNVKTENPKH